VTAKQPENSESIRFKLEALDIEGITVEWFGRDSRLYEGLLGEEISLTRVYEIAEKLTALYGNEGYALSKAVVPPQTIENGHVALRVIEGYINDVQFDGAVALDPDVEEQFRAAVTESKPLKVAVLERQLLVINDLPGLSLKSVLNASETEEGASELVVNVEETEISGELSVDNRGSDSVGPVQVIGTITYPNLISHGDGLTLTYATVPNQNELHYINLDYTRRITVQGSRINVDYSQSYSLPGEQFRILDIKTESSSVGISTIHPIVRSRSENLSISPGLRFSQSATLKPSGLGVLQEFRDDLSIAEVNVVYDKSDSFSAGGLSLLALNVSKGLKLFGAGLENRPAFDPAADFTSVELNARRIQQFNESWSLDLKLRTQKNFDRLPSGRQFGLGGEGTVRGYDPSEWAGDSGISATFQLQKRVPVEDFAGDIQVYGFYDVGKTWRESKPGLTDPLTDLAPWGSSVSARSIGIGTNLSLPSEVSLNFEAVNPLDLNLSGRNEGWKLYARLAVGF